MPDVPAYGCPKRIIRPWSMIFLVCLDERESLTEHDVIIAPLPGCASYLQCKVDSIRLLFEPSLNLVRTALTKSSGIGICKAKHRAAHWAPIGPTDQNPPRSGPHSSSLSLTDAPSIVGRDWPCRSSCITLHGVEGRECLLSRRLGCPIGTLQCSFGASRAATTTIDYLDDY
jgi:hypothetical protein